MNNRPKHFTASTFVFSTSGGDWRLALIHHRKFDRWMIPGGHLELNENPAEAAIREAREELGIHVSLVSLSTALQVPVVEDSWPVLPPSLIVEEIIPASGPDPEHIHIDCLYVAKAEHVNLTRSVGESADVKWFEERELSELRMFDTTKRIAHDLFRRLRERPLDSVITSQHL